MEKLIGTVVSYIGVGESAKIRSKCKTNRRTWYRLTFVPVCYTGYSGWIVIRRYDAFEKWDLPRDEAFFL